MSEDVKILDEITVEEINGEVGHEERTVEVFEVEEEASELITSQDAFPALGEDNETLSHQRLYGRDAENQHPITSITGLREELDLIESLKTVYSDKKQLADYYMWHDENPLLMNRDGLFVSMSASDDLHGGLCCIKVCDGNQDVFGVTVSEAALVGGQEYVQAEDGTKTGRNRKYGLVVYSGIAGVRCETTVTVGNYVVPNVRGEAKKSDGDYGYLVVAMSMVNGIQYAIISLSAPFTLAQKIADSVRGLSENMSTVEYNITSVTNVANSAYALAKDAKENAEVSSEYLEEKIAEVLDRMDKIDGEDGVVDNLNQSINNACSDAALAKTIANNAVSAAQQMGDDAYAAANEAIAAIKDIGAGSTSWAKRIDAYSVGEYSQAYGLTLTQARSALATGIIHIPTIIHTEIYDWEPNPYNQEFYIGYYYEWNGEKWVPSLSTAVNFSNEYIGGTNQTPYWIVTDDDVEHNGVVYKLGHLYKWENGEWSMTGANVEENTLSRAVSAMHQTANTLSMDVTDIKGDVASIQVIVDENSADIQSMTQWTKGKTADGEDLYNIATIKQTADDDGSSLSLVVADAEGNKVLKGASIVLGQNEDDSFITVDADQIVMNGTTVFLTPNDVGEGGATVIDGARIKTGQIDTDRLDVSEIITVGTDDITTITEDTISTTNVLAKNLQVEGANVKNLNANSVIVSGGQTVQDVVDQSIVSTTIYYALSASVKTPPADNDWSEEKPEKEGKQYMWHKTVNVYGDGSAVETIVCVDGKGVISVDITSSTGTIYINNEIRATLTAKVYQDNQDITSEFPDSAFLWEKYDMDGIKDTVWSYIGKTVAINNLDIYKRAMFNCILDVEQRS